MAYPNHQQAAKPSPVPHSYARIVRRIGLKLRELYGTPEAEPLPSEHVDLLLRLRQKERERMRLGGA